jgi:hypothetical protein
MPKKTQPKKETSAQKRLREAQELMILYVRKYKNMLKAPAAPESQQHSGKALDTNLWFAYCGQSCKVLGYG